MKKNCLILMCCALLVLPNILSAQKSLNQPFKEIIVNGKIELILQQSEEETIDVPYDGEKIEYHISDGVLRVKRTEMWKFKNYKKNIRVFVSYKQLRAIKATAGAEVECKTLLTGDFLELKFGSGAFGEIAAEVSDVEVSVGEGSKLKLEGKSDFLSARATTGGVLSADDMHSLQVFVRATTGGIAKVSCNDSLEATANTGGVISYYGNPEMVKVKESLGGNVSGI